MKTSDIICISTHYWHDFWFRKQHFMSRFVERGYRVLYVQPTYSMVRGNHKPRIARNRFFRSLTERESEKLYLFCPPRMLPKPTLPSSSKMSYLWFSHLVAQAARKIGMSDPILWVYRPEYAVGMDTIPHGRLVFDLADDLAAYNRKSALKAHVAWCTSELARKADLMVVTSPTLRDKYRNQTRRCVLVPNGFDERLFDGRPKPLPADLAPISRPIVGFVGVLFSFLDYDLLYDTARAMPHVSFVFVGPTEAGGRVGVERVKTLPNTHFLGPKPRQAIPSYVSHFDLCINPFRVDDVSRAVSPLKVYEYLACGKPVVSTPMEGLAREEAGKWLRFAGPATFAHALSEELRGKANPEQAAQCVNAAKAFSWTSQFNKLTAHMQVLNHSGSI